MKITVENKEGNTIVLTFNEDSDIYEWRDYFKTILLWATFYPETIKEILKDDEEEIQENTN